MHAALADPVRLGIVDSLARGDKSPTELQAEFSIGSNLLSHHLKVLESVRIVSRLRSQGDHRRSYVSLTSRGSAVAQPPAQTAAHRVVFVCTANSARSQLAAALWMLRSDVPASSAGTHPAARIDPGARAVARRRNLGLPDLAPQSLVDVLDDNDFVITVCDSAHEELSARDALHWSIPDPVLAGTPNAFDAAYDELATRISAFAPLVTAA
jgi:protein-tyrosine-phosphatase/DNA-binding transcriptional ArsR family regulator